MLLVYFAIFLPFCIKSSGFPVYKALLFMSMHLMIGSILLCSVCLSVHPSHVPSIHCTVCQQLQHCRYLLRYTRLNFLSLMGMLLWVNTVWWPHDSQPWDFKTWPCDLHETYFQTIADTTFLMDELDCFSSHFSSNTKNLRLSLTLWLCFNCTRCNMGIWCFFFLWTRFTADIQIVDLVTMAITFFTPGNQFLNCDRYSLCTVYHF